MAPVFVTSSTAAGNIGVVYPEVGEPYRQIFATIIKGIQEQLQTRAIATVEFPLAADASSRELAQLMREQDVRVLIALGKKGYNTTRSASLGIPIVTGGILSLPESEIDAATGYSLAPDPALLFSRLKALMPEARRIHVVYNPAHNGWLIRLAQVAAREQGLELVARQAGDIRSAALLYRTILGAAVPREEALWLLQDLTTVDDSIILPLVLQFSWERNLIVFSSSLPHVERGVLFALYPDNLETGRHLADLAYRLSTVKNIKTGMNASRAVRAAANTKTAAHLGINLKLGPAQTFDLLFHG